ncbi:RNase H domain-containing protein [Trichonephila clavipes]|nr:RNase H domain-containing protein [Trichonephila clavipes]
MEELEAAIAKMNPGKAPGPDVIFGRMLCGTSWGSRPQTLKSTFCTVIRPVLEYATPIWTPASISVKRKLDSVQHRAVKIIIGAVSSTNNEKAEQECGLPPLESRRKLATIKFTNKLRSYGLDHISRRVFDKWKHSTRLKRSSTLQLDSEIRKELNLNFAIAYTDGSSDRSLSNGGAGIILLLPDGHEDSPRQDKIICSMQTLPRSSTDAQSHLGMPNRRNKVTKNGNGPSEGTLCGSSCTALMLPE